MKQYLSLKVKAKKGDVEEHEINEWRKVFQQIQVNKFTVSILTCFQREETEIRISTW